MRDHDDLPYIVIERQSGAVVPFLWGALVGAAVALLWAPRSGRETQRELRLAGERMKEAASIRVNDARSAMAGAVDGVRQGVREQFDSVRDAVETRAEEVKDAVESGRRAARDARSDLERRVAEAKREAELGAEAERAVSDIVVTDVTIEDDGPPVDRI
jgi:gas vesicle protein